MRSEESHLDAVGKGHPRTPIVGSPEESDGNIVPEKSANKGVAPLAESMEGRTPTERNSGQEAAHRTQSRVSASNGLDRVRQRAEADKTFRFNNLFHFLKVKPSDKGVASEPGGLCRVDAWTATSLARSRRHHGWKYTISSRLTCPFANPKRMAGVFLSMPTST